MIKRSAKPKPYALHPTPYTLHPTPYTLHPTPYTLHPTPYTLHPTPCTLNQIQGGQGRRPYSGAFFLFFITLGLELSDTKSTSLKYEPSFELRRITAGQLFSASPASRMFYRMQYRIA